MEINIHHILSPSIVVTILTPPLPKEYHQKCIQETYRIGDQQSQDTNVKAIMSSYTIWQETDVFNPLISKIEEAINKGYPQIDARYNLKTENAWFCIYQNGHYTPSHHHHPSTLSWIYYLKTHEDSSPLIFDKSNFEITPQEGLLVMFPSHLFHSVPKHEGKDRICLAGNCVLHPNPIN